jgi:glucose-1-phosphate adenylyltransferase
VRGKGADHVIILSGDHIYKMNYLKMLTYHKAQNADLTISGLRLKKRQAAGRYGILEVNGDLRLFGFEEKPARPKPIPNASDYTLASMGIYVFTTDVLLKALQEEGDDFGKDIIPRMIDGSSNIFVYDFTEKNKIEDFIVEVAEGKRRKVLVDRTRDSSYWRDVGSIDSYYKASMDLLSVDPIFNLYGEKWVIRTCQRPLPPSKCVLGGSV